MQTNSGILIFALAILFLLSSPKAMAQTLPSENRKVSLVFGLNQPIVTQGFNFEVVYWTKKLVFSYSHGFGLQFKDNLVSGEVKRQHLNYNIKHSLGVGIGYRLTDNLNIRVEPKFHTWDVYYNDQFKANKITSYNTFTLGLGAYYAWQPFRKKENFLGGITIVPSIRWWPNVATSLPDDRFTYHNQITGTTETVKASNIGMNNTPFFANISLGYTFGTKK
jgi:hypothetical protein